MPAVTHTTQWPGQPQKTQQKPNQTTSQETNSEGLCSNYAFYITQIKLCIQLMHCNILAMFPLYCQLGWSTIKLTLSYCRSATFVYLAMENISPHRPGLEMIIFLSFFSIRLHVTATHQSNSRGQQKKDICKINIIFHMHPWSRLQRNNIK